MPRSLAPLMRSIKRNDGAGPPIIWNLPEGWKQTPGDQFRYAICRFGPDDVLELGISHAGGSVLDNVNRWRGQLGLAPLASEKALRDEKIIEDLTVGDLKVVMVDMTGTPEKGKLPGQQPPAPEAPAKAELHYTTPEDWKAVKPSSPIVFGAFRLPGSSNTSPEVTITPLPGKSGSLLDNINRWRRQIGLEKISEEPKDLKKIKVAGNEFSSLELTGPAGPKQQRMLVTFCKRGQTTWFFKLLASADMVAKNQAAFEAFVKSVRFDADPGAKP